MKIRILDDSVRLRLTRGEVARIGGGATVEATTNFPGQPFRYALERGEVPGARARFDGGRIVVTLPHEVAASWAGSDEVSIEALQELEGGASLRLLIEKDFKCLAPRDGEQDEDAFDHPLAGQAEC